MKRNNLGIVSVGCAVLLACGLASLSLAQVTKGKSRPATTEQLMAGIVKPHSASLKKALDANPSGDAWQEIALQAALLNEISYSLMEDGRCPDEVWANTCKTLREGSAAALKAAATKDLDAARTAFDSLSKSCKGCHQKHR